jgi:hypothetical protein
MTVPDDEDFEAWRARLLKDPMSADGTGCLLLLASVGTTLAGCAVTGAILFSSKELMRGTRGVAFVLAIPSILLGIAAFFVLAPHLYARRKRGGVDDGSADMDARRQSMWEAADRLRLVERGTIHPEVREIETDLAPTVQAMRSRSSRVELLHGTAAGAAGRDTAEPARRLFDHVVTAADGSRTVQTVLGLSVPEGTDMSSMLQLPPGLFAVSEDGTRVLIVPSPRWVYYLTPGRLQRGAELARFIEDWTRTHQEVYPAR